MMMEKARSARKAMKAMKEKATARAAPKAMKAKAMKAMKAMQKKAAAPRAPIWKNGCPLPPPSKWPAWVTDPNGGSPTNRKALIHCYLWDLVLKNQKHLA